jgi:hypothetical protein
MPANQHQTNQKQNEGNAAAHDFGGSCAGREVAYFEFASAPVRRRECVFLPGFVGVLRHSSITEF